MNTRPEQLRDIPEGVQTTHWPSCWREHRACAIARVELAEARVAEVDQALLACQERCHELEYRIGQERSVAETFAAAAEARSVRLAESLRRLLAVGDHLRFPIMAFAEDSQARAALAEHDAAKGEG